MTAMPVPDTPARALPPGDRAAEATTNLKRVRWMVRATLLLGVAASVAANILHANPNLISQAIAAWPPVALLLTVELISRIPVHRLVLAAARLIATTAIAGIAAWVSYWHMAGVAARYGEVGASAYLLPLSVDGLIVVASISLVELSGRLRAAQGQPDPTPAPFPPPPPASPVPPPAWPPEPNLAAPPPGKPTPPTVAPDDAGADRRVPAAGSVPDQREDPSWPNPSDDGGAGADGQPHPGDGDDAPEDGAPQRRRRGATEKAVIETFLKNPGMHHTAIAEAVGTSERSVRRYLERFKAGAGAGSPSEANGSVHDS